MKKPAVWPSCANAPCGMKCHSSTRERRGRREGRQEGRIEGESRLLRKMIEIKFGAIPGWAEAVLRSADSEQIDRWAESILTAESLETLLGKQ